METRIQGLNWTHYMRGILYPPIDSQKRQIRLCSFEPTQDLSKPMRLYMLAFDVDASDNMPYVALSYEWNPPICETMRRQPGANIPDEDRHMHFAEVNEEDFPVTFNLALALKCLWKTCGMGVYFWIDAICIEQGNPQERAHQVSLMRDIYKDAAEVWVWNGTPSMFGGWGRLSGLLEVAKGDDAVNKIRDAILDRDNQPLWDAFHLLMTSSYWSRCWIVQELAVAQKRRMILLYSGTTSLLDLDDVFNLVAVLLKFKMMRFRNRDTATEGLGPGPFDNHLTTLIEFVRNRATVLEDLLEVLIRFTDHRATDPRDKVYSFLGITKPYHDGNIKVDYECSASDVFKRTAVDIIQGSKHLEILALAGARVDNLPTWAPDWSEVELQHSDLIRLGVTNQRPYWHPAPTIDTTKSLLNVKAYTFGPVQPRGAATEIDADFEARQGFSRCAILLRMAFLHVIKENQALTEVIDEKCGKETRFMLSMLALVLATMYESAERLSIEENRDGGHMYSGREGQRLYFGEDPLLFIGKFLEQDLSGIPDVTTRQESFVQHVLADSAETFLVNMPYEVYGRTTPQYTSFLENFSDDAQAVIKDHSDKLMLPCICRKGNAAPITDSDVVAIVPGCTYPLLLETVDAELRQYKVKGPAWIPGTMGISFLQDLNYTNIQLL